MARNLRDTAYFLQYLNIEMHLNGFGVWRRAFTRFRDKRDFDVCVQLIALARTARIDQESSEWLKLYETELALEQRKHEYAERLLQYLVAHATLQSVKLTAVYRLADIQRASGRFQSALENYELALQMCEQIDDKATIPYLLHMIGAIYRAQDDFDKAIRFYTQSLEHYRHLQENWPSQEINFSNIVLGREDIRRHIANVLRDLADAHRKKREFDVASRYLLKSIEILESIQAKFEMVLTYLSLGRLCRDKHLFPDAIRYYKKALVMARETRSPLFEAESLSRLAQANYLTGNYQEAVEWAEKTVALANLYGFNDLKARALLYQGLSQLMLNHVQEATNSLLAALDSASQFNSNVFRSVSNEIHKVLPLVRSESIEYAEAIVEATSKFKERFATYK